MKTELQKIADSFIQLMKDFIQKNISGPYFKKQYFALWQPFIHHQDYLEIPENQDWPLIMFLFQLMLIAQILH